MAKSKLRMRLQLIVLLLPFILMSAVIAFGTTLSGRLEFARAVEVPAPPPAVYATLADVDALPSWSSRVLAVAPLPPRDGRAVWRQTFAGKRTARLERVTAEPPARLVYAIADEGGPYRGSWDLRLEPARSGTGTRVTLVERASLGNAVSRFLAFFAAGSTRFAEDHLRDLAAHFGAAAAAVETVEVPS